jgi:hypothetical protein
MGWRVTVSVEETSLGVTVTCDECGESVEVHGTGEASIRRGCVMLRDQCGSTNFYVCEDDGDDEDDDLMT